MSQPDFPAATIRETHGGNPLDPRLDGRLREVPWRDLTTLSPSRSALELLLPAPWLIASLILAHWHLWPLALAGSFVFFLTGLRVVHGAYHYAIGLPRQATELVMFVFSILMLGSMHAVQWNHLRHHRHCLTDDDIEAMGARGSAFRAVLLGPRFPFRLHRAALAGADRTALRWIAGELASNGVWLALVPGLIASTPLRYHVLAMAIGQSLTAFFAVWTVHHDCPAAGVFARTIRAPVRASLTFNMFFHLEHHLFPHVPTAHLPVLAQRLDRAMTDRNWSPVWGDNRQRDGSSRPRAKPRARAAGFYLSRGKGNSNR